MTTRITTAYVPVLVDEVLHETRQAFVVKVGDRKLFLPKSQVKRPELYHPVMFRVSLQVTEWIYRTKGLAPREGVNAVQEADRRAEAHQAVADEAQPSCAQAPG